MNSDDMKLQIVMSSTGKSFIFRFTSDTGPYTYWHRKMVREFEV